MLEVWKEFWKSVQGTEGALGRGIHRLEGRMKAQQLMSSYIIIHFVATSPLCGICSAAHGLSKCRSNAITIISKQSPSSLLT